MTLCFCVLLSFYLVKCLFFSLFCTTRLVNKVVCDIMTPMILLMTELPLKLISCIVNGSIICISKIQHYIMYEVNYQVRTSSVNSNYIYSRRLFDQSDFYVMVSAIC